MTKLDISISSIKYTIEVSDEEIESFKNLSKVLNQKTNELMMETGKISDRLLLFMVLLININRKERIFGNFEQNMIKLLRKAAPLLNSGENLDSNLIFGSILSENETKGIKEEKIPAISDENVIKILQENDKANEETLRFMDEIIKFVERLANNINKV